MYMQKHWKTADLTSSWWANIHTCGTAVGVHAWFVGRDAGRLWAASRLPVSGARIWRSFHAFVFEQEERVGQVRRRVLPVGRILFARPASRVLIINKTTVEQLEDTIACPEK
jgi:hypothetical protein